MPPARTTRRSAAAAAPPPPPVKSTPTKPTPAKSTTKKKPPTRRAPRSPSPTPTPSPSPPPEPPKKKPAQRGRPSGAAKKTEEAAAAAKKSTEKKGKYASKKMVYQDDFEDYLQAPGRRSCFADTSANNKWNFGPMSSSGRRKRDEMEDFLPKPERNANSLVKKNFKKGTIKFDLELIHPFVMCRLCDGYLIDATTIIDCMHTFCKSCLLLYFEEDENTCPTCGILIHGSHPAQYVTFDRAINDLVMKLVPNLEEQEKQNRREFLNSFRNVDNHAEEKAKKKAKEEERKRGTNRCYRGDPTVSHHRDDNMVMVKLVPGKDLPLTTRPFIRTSEMTTINTLKKYLALSLWDDQNKYSDLDIFCDNQLMGKDFSIRFVWMMKRRSQPKHIPLELNYRNSI